MMLHRLAALIVCLLLTSCGKPGDTATKPAPIPKPTPDEAQKMLDKLWGDYPILQPNQRPSDEVQFRRVKIRKQVRAILAHYPDWSPGGPKPGPDNPAHPDKDGSPLLTQAQLRETLTVNEEFDSTRP